MGRSKEHWIVEREFLMEEIFDAGIHCEKCKYKISIPAEDMSGEGHWQEPQRECEVQGDPDECIGVQEEWHDGMYADRYIPT